MNFLKERSIFNYSRFYYLRIDLVLLIVLFGISLTLIAIRRGESTSGVVFVSALSAFFFAMWAIARSQLNVVTVDEQTISSSSLWGIFQDSIRWTKVAQVEYSTVTEPLQKENGPRTYIIRPQDKNPIRPFGRHGIAIGVELTNFPTLLAILERKSAEFGFPIQPMRSGRSKPAKPATL